ncbi:MAG: SRPBCC family protein, partial [Bacteroidales bacterium]
MLSDLNNISRIKDRIPSDKIKGLKFDTDRCSLVVDPVGDVTFYICSRESGKTIKFMAENSPIPLFVWIQMLPVTEGTSKLKVTCQVELNMFLKNMVSKQLQEGMNKIADVLAALPYDK